MQPRKDIEALLNPRAVAIVGTVNHAAPAKFLAPLRERFGDRFRLVDPAGGAVEGIPVQKSVESVPGDLDVAVIDVPSDQVCGVAEACARRKVPHLVVVTSPDADQEQRLLEIVRTGGMRMVGPNGSLNLYEPMPEAPVSGVGKIGLITQSGHMGRVMIQSHRHGVAFSRWIPTSNEADLDATDFIEYLAYDEGTAVIAGYFEGFRDGIRLRHALAATVAQDKPVVVVKVGRHQAATRMAETHSAHLTGSDAAIDGLFKQYGVIRVDDVDELIETAAACAKLSLPAGGGRVALYGISGAAVALMADQAEAHGVSVPALTAETQRALHDILPSDLGVANPVDPGNLYRTGTAADRKAVLEAIGSDPNVDIVVCALTGVIKGITDDFVADITSFRKATSKGVVTTWNTWEMETPAYTALVASGIPIFRSFRGCFGSLHAIFERRRRMPLIQGRTIPVTQVRAADRTRRLDPGAAAELLVGAGIAIAPERIVRTAAEASAAARELGMPVALKAHVAETAHKTDLGLVVLGLDTPEKVRDSFEQLAIRAGAVSKRSDVVFQIQRQLPPGVELIVGVVPDSILGAALLAGSGGIFAEVTADVSVRPLPVTRFDVEEMLGELACHPLLTGARGRPAADLDAVAELMLRVAIAAEDPTNGIVELDLNPVIAGPQSAVAVDSLVIVRA